MPIVRWFTAACLLLASHSTEIVFTPPARADQKGPAAVEKPLHVGPLTIGGYAQFDGVFPLGSHTSLTTGTFRVRRARVYVSGDLTPGIGWLLQADVAASPILRDAYVTFRQISWANVRVGQFIAPFSLERLTSSARLEAIDRLYERFTPSRDIGAGVFNSKPFWRQLSYSAAVINGTGQNAHDDNDAKDVVGRLTWSVPAVNGLDLAANAQAGRQPAGVRSRWGGDVNFGRREYRVAAEYIHEMRDGWNQPVGHAFYVLGVKRFLPSTPHRDFHMAEIVVRAGSSLDPILLPTELRTAERRQIEAGGNYYFSSTVRVMADVTLPINRPQGTPRATLIARAQFMF